MFNAFLVLESSNCSFKFATSIGSDFTNLDPDLSFHHLDVGCNILTCNVCIFKWGKGDVSKIGTLAAEVQTITQSSTTSSLEWTYVV